MCLLFVIFFRTSNLSNSKDEAIIYTQYLNSSCEEALRVTIESKQTVLNENHFFNSEDIETIVETLHKCVNVCFKSSNQDDNYILSMRIPIICIVDNDGFYINHMNKYLDEKEYITATRTTTPSIPWTYTTSDGRYLCKFYLNDYIDVIKLDSNKIYSGTYSDVYQQLNRPISLSFMNNTAEYIEQRSICIKNITEDVLSDYINEYNYAMRDLNYKYSINIEGIDIAGFTNGLVGPTLFAVMQGPQYNVDEYPINIYSMCGACIAESDAYYIEKYNGRFYYHKSDCSLLINETMPYSSSEECAMQGAYPCNHCCK